MKITLAVLALGAAILPVADAQAAGPFDDLKDVVLDRDGQAMTIGSVAFRQRGDKTGFDLRLDPTKFGQFFLPMKQFKCARWIQSITISDRS